MNICVGQLTSDQPLVSMKIDPSSERGARLQAIRLRLKWLEKGWDVPVTYSVVVHSSIRKNGKVGSKARDIYSPKLLFEHGRKVSPEEANKVKDIILNEMTGWAQA